MQKIKTVADLKTAIQQLEYKQANQLLSLKEQFHATHESLKPWNVFKNTFKEFTSSPDFKGTILSTTIGLATGYLSKSLVVGASHNPIKKLIGSFLQLAVTNGVSKNPEVVKSMVGNILSFFSKTKTESSR